MSTESIIALAIGILSIFLLIVLVTLAALMLCFLSSKKSNYNPDSVSSNNPGFSLSITNTSVGSKIPNPVMVSDNSAYGLTVANTSGTGGYEVMKWRKWNSSQRPRLPEPEEYQT